MTFCPRSMTKWHPQCVIPSRLKLIHFGAKVLAANTQRIVLTPGDVTDHVSHEGVVVRGDVRDPSWFGLSVFMPFTDITWSAPCQPWGLAGNAFGFSSDLGLLLAHAIGILVLFKPLRAVGENVAGLHMHPQWERVRHLFGSPTTSREDSGH